MQKSKIKNRVAYRGLLNLLFLIFILKLIFILPGCGKKADPRAPVRYIPGAVKDLVARQKENRVLLSWKMPEENEDGTPIKDLVGFLILRAEILEGTGECRCKYKRRAMIYLERPEPAIIKDGTVTFLDKGEDLSPPGLIYGKTYGYKVFSMNRSKILSKEREARVTLSVPPGPPEGFMAIAGEGKVTLSWSPPIKRSDGTELTDLKGYNIYRTRERGVYGDEPVNSGLILSLTYLDQGLQNNKTYYYIVKAVNNLTPPWNEGPPSEEISVTPQKMTPPAPPKRVIAVPAEGKIFLTWDENTEPEVAGYKVYRSLTPKTGFTLLTHEPIIKTTFTDPDVVSNTRYYYRVTAIDNAIKPNESLPSEEVEAEIK